MNTIDLSSEKLILTEGHSSKGNQSKWRIGDMWYKADHMGYEALSEVIVSRLLETMNISDYVKYEPIMIKYGDRMKAGCFSHSFLNKNEELIPFERLHRSYTGMSLAGTISGFSETSAKISYTVDFISEITGLDNVGKYISAMLEIDAFFLNEDRHTNNLAVIRNSDDLIYRLAPVFDNGLSLLSDLNDYPLDIPMYDCIKKAEAKPFCRNFEEQADEAVKLYGHSINFSFNRSFVRECIEDMAEYYSDDILIRVENVLTEQMRKYAML